jgi:hypothetical protein
MIPGRLAAAAVFAASLIVGGALPAGAFGTKTFNCDPPHTAQGSSASGGGSYTVSTGCPDVRVRNRFSGSNGPYSYGNQLVAISGGGAGWIGGTHGARNTTAHGYYSTIT